MSEGPKTRRLWFRWSLRTLLVVIAVLCVAVAVPVNRASRQRRAVARLHEIDGIERYDYEVTPKGPPPKLAWLRNLLDIHFFDTVTIVFFIGSNAHGADLKVLGEFPHLAFVNMEQSNVTGDDLAYIEHLRNVKSFGLGGSNATNVALEHVCRMPQVESITVDLFNRGASKVTDKGLVPLAQLKKLSSLALNGGYISDAGLVHLEPLTTLKQLTLYDTQVTKDGIARLRKSLPACQIKYGERRPGQMTP